MKTARFFTVKGGYPDMGALVESRVGARYGGTLMGGFSGDPGRSPIWGYPDMGALVGTRVGARYGGTPMGGFSGGGGRSPIWGYPDGGL